jgi:hypothetical protein
MRSSSKLTPVVLAVFLLALPSAADARRPKPRSPVGEAKIAPSTPRAEPAARRVKDESSCRRDGDCVFLPSICDRCAPCKPAWRPVGNRAALKRIQSMQARVRCAAVRCQDCAKASNWLGKKPICARGRCWIKGKPLPAKGPPQVFRPRVDQGNPCYKACLKSNMARAEGWESIKARCQTRCRTGYQPSGPQQPTKPWSKDRSCKRDHDCVLRPRSPCTCSPCTPTWHSAINRARLKALRSRWARMRCRHPVCPACVARWLGTKAVCRKGQCVVQ